MLEFSAGGSKCETATGEGRLRILEALRWFSQSISMPITLTQFQQHIQATFGAKDSRRGVEGTFMWFMEEVGELAEALRGHHTPEATAKEFADVLAWLATLANIVGVNLDEAVALKYGTGCPSCHHVPCSCSPTEKP